jgi:hypothetical protein
VNETWSQPRVPLPLIRKGWASFVNRISLVSGDKGGDMRRVGDTHRIMRMQSPKTGMKSWETWDIEGWALAKRTSSASSMGPGMLRVEDCRKWLGEENVCLHK